MVPDGELPVLSLCVHQPSSVIGRLGEGDALLFCLSLNQRVCLMAECATGCIEGNAAEVIADGWYARRDVLSVSGAVIEGSAVGRESREGFPYRIALDERRGDEFIPFSIVNLQVGGKVKHLDELVGQHMKTLACGVGGVGDISSAGMPVRIYAESQRAVCLCVVSIHLTIQT